MPSQPSACLCFRNLKGDRIGPRVLEVVVEPGNVNVLLIAIDTGAYRYNGLVMKFLEFSRFRLYHRVQR